MQALPMRVLNQKFETNGLSAKAQLGRKDLQETAFPLWVFNVIKLTVFL